jgi:hypothetical protein
MIEKQFGTEYGPALHRGEKTICIVSLQAEIDRYHRAIAVKARCSVSTVPRALKWARQHGLIHWAHGLVRHGWRVLRTVADQQPVCVLSISDHAPPHLVHCCL